MTTARLEARGKSYGIFGYAGPGFLHWSAVLTGDVPTLSSITYLYSPKTYFASGMGGGVEYFPSPRVHLRAEIGDLILLCPTCGTHNLQTSAGVYVEVGKPVPGHSFDVDSPPSHRFFDRTNAFLFGMILLGQSADAITTQRFLSHGGAEGDPLERPLVEKGWGGQIAANAINISADIVVMYGLHKLGHHKLERLLPVGQGAESAYFAYSGLQGR